MLNYNDYPPQDVASAVDKAVTLLRGIKFDSIAVRGVSGIMVGAPVAYILRKPLLVVRKQEDMISAHTSIVTSNWSSAGQSYVIIDDMYSSGKTLQEIQKAVFNDAIASFDKKPVLRGVYLYMLGAWYTLAEMRKMNLVYEP